MTSEQRSPQQYNVVIDKDVMMTARDGIQLGTDVYRPALPIDGSQGGVGLTGEGLEAVEGTFPVILERTPYDKTGLGLRRKGHYYARRGYVVVIQDVRGRFTSEGEWYAFGDEGPDGYDTCAWIVEQPWSNGKIATTGCSYAGCTQSALASLNPPGLAGMFVEEGPWNYHTASMRHNGACEMRFMIYAFRMATTSKEALSDPRLRQSLDSAFANVAQWVEQAPLKKGVSPLAELPSYEQWHLDVLTHGDLDEYWERPGYGPELFYNEHADVPTVYFGGWYDSYARSTCTNYVELSERKDSPQTLIMGPFTHGTGSAEVSHAGDVDFGREAAIYDMNELRLHWYDHWLKGEETGAAHTKPVQIFVMGGGTGLRNSDGRLDHGGQWRAEDEWPLARTQWTPFYLHADGGLSADTPSPTKQERQSSFTFDPANPVPTIGGNLSAGDPVLVAGAYDQRGDERFFGYSGNLPLAARPDVLVFQTPPLEEDIEVTGPLTLKLWVSSTAVDTDFTVKLLDVHPPNGDYPEGFAMNITDSIQRARYRNSREKAEMLEPGVTTPLTIEMYPTSNVFAKGHRIRLDVSSSNFPRFDVNPNTGEPLGRHTRLEEAHNTVFHEPGRPSHIVLPVIPKCDETT